ncbi:DEAD/DEAH box helicase [Roseiconus lacunae]|uniref:DEAD/DEAH box helicase n=1 Tax=Roseiconus lacunae TaxID=2605694 RepID=A0ABT7PC35_9BACT|nr:DEAD/DEAH box helicase [Roseiconus lacunae]MDM4014049.1 DEAD/DEAH box helicase [Roseiconus lacunae]
MRDNYQTTCMQNFESMDLFRPLQRALSELNYKHPTPIQAQAIPPAIDGVDILGCASTGTGKTAAFAIPILDYLGFEKPRAKPNRPTALVLAPTRELAIQIGESFDRYGKHMKFRQTLVYGGIKQGSQTRSLGKGTDVLVATPGRLIDLMDQGHVDLSDVQIFVLDEADRMLDMGFLPALKRIVTKLPRERQSMFFSATLAPKIRELAATFLFNPVAVTVPSKSMTADGVDQTIRFMQKGDKFAELQSILSTDDVERAIVFTRTKRGANRLVQKLDRQGITGAAIHGNKSQQSRQRALQAFRDKRVSALVATDVAARGIDVQGVTHVINYDMPVEPESYVHRIGRTGRAGKTGIAISFCTEAEIEELRAIKKLIGSNLRVENEEHMPKSPKSSSTSTKKKSARNTGSRHHGSRNTGSGQNRGTTQKTRSKSRRKPHAKRKPVTA